MRTFLQFFFDSASRKYLRSMALHCAAHLRNQFFGAFALKQGAQNDAKNDRTADCEHPRNEAERGMDYFDVHNRNQKNEGVPDSSSHGTPVEQPSPENCSHPPYVLLRTVGMARTGYCGKRSALRYESLHRPRS
jgi:hypothetical protein